MKKGFTLLELLLTLSAGVLILGVLLGFHLNYFRAWEQEWQKQNVNQLFISATEKIALGIAQNNRIDVSTLPYEDIRVERIQDNLYKVTFTIPYRKNTYFYENYFRPESL